jgi:two-component system phosphate regulon sensor histidine kinase PhoR
VQPEIIGFLALMSGALAVAVTAALSRGRTLDRIRSVLDDGHGGDPETAARGAQDALAEARSREGRLQEDLAQLTDDLESGIVRLDDDLRVVMANRAACTILGQQRATLIGRSAMEAFVDHRVEALAQSAAERGASSREVVFPASERTLFLRGRRAATGGIWLLLEDVTELRRLQRIRTEFIDNLSHELRTPLTTIRLLTETVARDLERASVPPRIRDRIQKIDVETGHLVQMVNELLDLSRIEGGATQLDLDEVDLARVIRGALERLRTFADRQRVELIAEIEADGPLPHVRGDEERLGQLLINLLHNAVKFSPASSRVVVRARRSEGEVVVSVEDQGVGIPKADLDRVFERFYKVDKARVRGAGGTGLGLSIARHIAEGHGGRIWVESEEGQGSVFSFAIPLTEG